MHHHLLVYLCPETELSIVARIRKTSRLEKTQSQGRVAQEEVGLLHVLCFVETTQVTVKMDRQASSRVVKRVTS